MNLFLKFGIKERIKQIASVALLVGFANSVFGYAAQSYLTANNYVATTGGTISGDGVIAEDTSPSCPSTVDDQVWENWDKSGGTTLTGCLDLSGTGTNPITSTDVNYPVNVTCGTSQVSFTYPNNQVSFSIACTNTALNYDKTGTLSMVSVDCTTLTAGYSQANVTIYNMASVMNVAILSAGTNYSSDYIIRGEGNQTNYIHIYRATGDTLNQRTVTYVLSGNAVSNVDWTGPLTNSVTIPSGTNSVVIPVKAVQNTNIIGTRFLTITLTSGYYQINTNAQTATIAIIQDVPTFDITAPNAYASPNQYDVGEFTITRTGGLSNSITANLAVGGTATPGSDYTTLPASVKFGTNQTSTNLFVYANNANMSTLKTVVLSIVTNSAYEMGLTTDAAVDHGQCLASVFDALWKPHRLFKFHPGFGRFLCRKCVSICETIVFQWFYGADGGGRSQTNDFQWLA